MIKGVLFCGFQGSNEFTIRRIRRYLANVHYDNTSCRVSSLGDAKYFCLKLKGFKGFFEIFWFGMMASLEKLVLFSEGKLFKTWINWKEPMMKIITLMTKYYPGFVIRILAKIFQKQILKIKIFNFVRGHTVWPEPI